jgi:hypothetical protein
MPNSDKRHATIDLLPIAHITKNPTKPDPVLGAPDAYKRIAPSAFSQIRFQPPSSTVRKFSPLHRPADFPIATHGFKLACPWTCYRKTYRLRFGVDYWLTGAQQVQKPCDEVLVQEFSRTTNKDELQRLQELRHDNIHAVLKAFQQDKTIHVVFEYMELSLHDIAKVGVKTPELAAILGQVRLLAAAMYCTAVLTPAGGRRSRVPLGAGPGTRLAHVLYYVGQQGGCSQDRFVGTAHERCAADTVRQEIVYDAVLAPPVKVSRRTS